MASQGLAYDGCNFFRQRLVLSTLSGKRLKIRNIRSKDDNPGIRDFEASFIRLLDKVTNGSRIEINQTGTVLFYQPGLLNGGSVEHDCCLQRSIGYYLEALLMLAPFMKNSLKATLRGVTNDPVDPTVDRLKSTALPLMKKFGIDGEGFDLKVIKRGMAPGGGGEVLFTCPVRKTVRPVQLTDPGKIKRIRGVAYSVRVSPQMGNRIVESTRGILNHFIPDIYIHTDHMKGANSGKSKYDTAPTGQRGGRTCKNSTINCIKKYIFFLKKNLCSKMTFFSIIFFLKYCFFFLKSAEIDIL
ncbi:RNA 3'-terminal phosphate cyclase-like protein isoform X6 [Corythoichthys intestinalis]|uniref:RNA 3'-terminal phosphate cyclase-like protein isoform X6 n=1 Tax=Corythoichthys intestinalis TaxID=161448 RepID=UPI0025A4F39B|nr:RNA 3'-terminal phosphate cyclase-like protein isoform X6 [Corythoichthys intestinalis]